MSVFSRVSTLPALAGLDPLQLPQLVGAQDPPPVVVNPPGGAGGPANPGPVQVVPPGGTGAPLNVPPPAAPTTGLQINTPGSVFANGEFVLTEMYRARVTRAQEGIVYRVNLNGVEADFRFNSDSSPPRWEWTPAGNQPNRTWSATNEASLPTVPAVPPPATDAHGNLGRIRLNALATSLHQLGGPDTGAPTREQMETFQLARRYLDTNATSGGQSWSLRVGGRDLHVRYNKDELRFEYHNAANGEYLPLLNLSGSQPAAAQLPGGRAPDANTPLAGLLQLVSPTERAAAVTALQRREDVFTAMSTLGSPGASTTERRIWNLGGPGETHGQISFNIAAGRFEYRKDNTQTWAALPTGTTLPHPGVAATWPAPASATTDEARGRHLLNFAVQLTRDIQAGTPQGISSQNLRVAAWETELIRASNFEPSGAMRFQGQAVSFVRVGDGQFLLRPEIANGRVRWTFGYMSTATSTEAPTFRPLSEFRQSDYPSLHDRMAFARVAHCIDSLRANEGIGLPHGILNIGGQTQAARQVAVSLQALYQANAAAPQTLSITRHSGTENTTPFQYIRFHNGVTGDNARGVDIRQNGDLTWQWRSVSSVGGSTRVGDWVRIGQPTTGSTTPWYAGTEANNFGAVLNDFGRMMHRYNPALSPPITPPK